MKLCFPIALAAALLASGCGSEESARIRSLADADNVTSLGNNLYEVVCRDGSRAIHTREEINAGQVCYVTAVVTWETFFADDNVACRVPANTALRLKTRPVSAGEGKVLVALADGFQLTGCSVRTGLIDSWAVRVIMMSNPGGYPSYPSYPSYPY